MSGPNLCCTLPQQRIDSPEPPARPLGPIDAIFAAAALPEDHPHAFKVPERKVDVDGGIVQSPNITSKIKMQFHRTSSKNLKEDREYDHDARQMTLQEVLKAADDLQFPWCSAPSVDGHTASRSEPMLSRRVPFPMSWISCLADDCAQFTCFSGESTVAQHPQKKGSPC